MNLKGLNFKTMLFDSTVFTAIITAASGLCAFLLGHIIGRKKNNADIENVETEIQERKLSNLIKTITIYEKANDNLDVQLRALVIKCEALSSEIKVLRDENFSLKVEVYSLLEKIKNRVK